MQIDKNIYIRGKGWQHEHLAALDSSMSLLLFFCGSSFKNSPEIIDLHRAFPNTMVIGASTAGEILAGEIFDDSIVYTLIKFEKTQLKLALNSDYLKAGIHQSGQAAADNLYDRNLKHVFLFSSGFNVNIDEFILGFKKNAGRDVSMSGGLAGDGEAFKETWIYHDGFHENAIAAIGLYGDAIEIHQGCEGGWLKFGLERRITKAENNVLYEIDKQPALASYKKYLGNLSEKLPASALLFPLAIRKNNQSSHVVRTILAVNEEDQSITFAGEIPNGWLASFMRCTNEGLIDGAKQAAFQSLATITGERLAIMVSCVGRRIVLGQGCFHELEAALSVIPKEDLTIIGFYSYGEISEKPDVDSKLHNQTMTITMVSEKMDE